MMWSFRWELLPTLVREVANVRIGTVLVRGPSMVPALYDGDRLLVGWRARIRPGDLVVARFRERPALLVVKRAVIEQEGGWLLASDNPFATGPGGVADVEARVLLLFWPVRRAAARRSGPSH
jgi:phage repressor protein C with HTH and peptisase S24 domain